MSDNRCRTQVTRWFGQKVADRSILIDRNHEAETQERNEIYLQRQNSRSGLNITFSFIQRIHTCQLTMTSPNKVWREFRLGFPTNIKQMCEQTYFAKKKQKEHEACSPSKTFLFNLGSLCDFIPCVQCL